MHFFDIIFYTYYIISMNSLKLFSILLLIFGLLFSSTFGHQDENDLSNDIVEEVKELRQENEELRKRVQFLENEKINNQTDLIEMRKVCEEKIIRLESDLEEEKLQHSQCKIKIFNISTTTTTTTPKTIIRPNKMNQYAEFNYGENFGDLKIPTAYDLETPVNFSLKFHGNHYSLTRIKKDGFIKFNQNGDYPLIALYWTGIETRNAGSIYYRVSSKSEELDLARGLIEKIEPGEINLTKLLILTYVEVPFEKAANTTTNCPGLALRNTFQGILATDCARRSFMIFNYIDLNWGPLNKMENKFCTGYSEIVKVGLRDEFSTRISFDNTFVNNQTFSNKDLLTKSNVGFPGVFVTRIDEQSTKNCLKFNSTISFGTSNKNSKLPIGFAEEVSVNYPFHMYGKLHSALIIHNFGFLRYLGGLSIYIFYTGIDTTYGGSVSYRVSSKSEDLHLAQILIERADPANMGLKLTSTVIVTYKDIPFLKSNETRVECPETPRNTYEVVLATDGIRSYVIFNYITLNWGGKLNDDPCTGFSPIINAGYFHDGDNYRLLDYTKGVRIFEGLGYKDLLTKTNIGIPGVTVTRVDQKPPN